eukprot:gnl/MRDRNA2_/MRDRNA2_16347_c0_seq1.p1 gnl/MRDRNA2_/MRDRNA2_16347_c0~~gnl/MRDRNA2_/MRDRNA2_16347_c0_seq1.p1  ORF type:complete len:310 (+),score=61.99 gnl/MRDRNA2_/MRDRNA2_16347_c0_seq1:126-1055(+)
MRELIWKLARLPKVRQQARKCSNAVQMSQWRVVRPKGFNESAFLSLDAAKAWPEVRVRSVPGFPGALQLSGVLPREVAEQYAKAAELLEFDDAHHPSYQSQDIDQTEESFRKNNRCVYQASEGQTQLLFLRVGQFLAPHLDAGQYGSWHLWGLNDMWRFYRYRDGQHFPIHCDNPTTKVANLSTWFSVLVYLTDGFEGGSTLLHYDAALPPMVSISPVAGDALIFFHMPPFSPPHSGAPPVGGNKYVLRTDVLYKAEASPGKSLPLSPPYDVKTYEPPAPTHVPTVAPEWEEYWTEVADYFRTYWSDMQ